MSRPLWTVKLNNGLEAIARQGNYGLQPFTYANRTQAERMKTTLGEGWDIYHRGQPFYVVKTLAQETAP